MNDAELSSCKRSDGKWQCPYEMCKQVLSRKQTMKSHLTSVHGIEGTWIVGQYKQYEFDSSIPVPRSTQAWQNKRRRVESHYQSPVLLEDPDPSPETELLIPQESGLENDLITQESSISSPAGLSIIQSVDEAAAGYCSPDSGSDMDICDTDSDSSDYEEEKACSDDCEEEEDNLDADGLPKSNDAPLYVIPPQKDLYESSISRKDHVLVTCALMSRHKTSDSMMKDQLKYLGLHIPEKNILEYDINRLKEKCGFENSFMKFHGFCTLCKTIFPDDRNTCPTPNCSGKKEDNSYFVTGDLKAQLINILTREGIWISIQETARRTSTSKTISDITDGTQYKKLKEDDNFLSNTNNISLSLFTDGVPLFKSSGVSLWPVYLLINELPSSERFLRKNMILWGVWQGNGKPNMTLFLKSMVFDLRNLHKNGISMILHSKEVTCRAILVVATMDLQARASVLHMTQHNGKYPCVYCMEPGEVVKSGKGHCRHFPYRNELILRSDDEIKTDGKSAQRENTKVNGFTGESVLNYLPGFSLKENVVVDYMHGILLGITKKLLRLWFESTFYNQPFFIGHKIKDIDIILKKITPPYLISRLPRKLSNTVHHWKASELRSWLLFYSIPCLKGRLPDEFLTHFSLLVEATATLLGEGMTDKDLDRCDILLEQFVKHAATMYGDNFVGLNVHNLLHLVPCVRKWGPLWAWSCFCFESFNGEIKKCVHGTGNVCRQIFWFLQAQKEIEKKVNEPGESAVKAFLHEMTDGGQRASGTPAHQCLVKGLSQRPVELSDAIKRKVFDHCNVLTLTGFSRASKIIRNGQVMYSKACTRVLKRNSYTISTIEKNLVEVEFFLLNNDDGHVYALCRPLESSNVLERRVPHIKQVSFVGDLDNVIVVNAECLQQVVVSFKVDQQKYIAYIPNSIERD